MTPVRTQQLGSAELEKFQVLILPDAGGGGGGAGEGYAEILGAGGLARLKQWVADGGTVIGLGSAVQFLADPRVGLLRCVARGLRVLSAVERAEHDEVHRRGATRRRHNMR